MESPGLTVHADVTMSFKVPELEGLLQVRGKSEIPRGDRKELQHFKG